ncbi:hypothetical protein [Bradyrhizobium lablabi]|uniref:hypothetical protein n=1 Tax=Bradyrhizobium lablabi TaxID=722472 RepID=UPI001BA9A496|nr:hypothetical protein [Bradyrhizobium lablabi]MBR0697736.1 hypothetical protein [Bradyrhizobium lablabi]
MIDDNIETVDLKAQVRLLPLHRSHEKVRATIVKSVLLAVGVLLAAVGPRPAAAQEPIDNEIVDCKFHKQTFPSNTTCVRMTGEAPALRQIAGTVTLDQVLDRCVTDEAAARQ